MSSFFGIRTTGINIQTAWRMMWVVVLAACHDAAPDLSKPESSRFDKVVLAENLDEPMQFEILKDGRVLFVERKGAIKCYNPRTKHTDLLAQVPVRHTFSAPGREPEESEDGIQGILLDPSFEENGWVYIYYAPLEGPPRNSLVRYKWDGGAMDLSKADVLLEIPVSSDICCHVGGGMVFDTAGNLLLATGENAQIGEFSTLDERPGKETSDGQRTAGNSNDLRGKIIRIHPLSDGTYEIPQGNLFPPGTPKTLPEIYTMGNRNPWRLSIDTKTNWLYWGEVGPGGGRNVEGRGPRAYDEFNQARKPGNYGYPYTIGNNFAYWKYDFEADTSGERYDPQRLVNRSPNNTGLEELPPSTPAFIWYPYANSEEFPELGSGGSSAVGGPIYRRADFDNPARPFPAYYEGKWFITDWVRGWIMVVTMDENGDYQSMEELIPGLSLNGAIDMDFGPDGDLYVLEYGSNGTFKGNPDARLIRIEYNSGNRKPVVQLAADKTAGAVPFTVALSSEGSRDYDNDPLTYEWTITSPGKPAQTLTGASVSVPFTEAGIYTATLVVDDGHGAKEKRDIRIIAGNDPPEITWDLGGSNQTFFFPNTTLSYIANIRDKEDGLTSNARPDPSRTEISIDYVSEASMLSKPVPSSDTAPPAGLIKLTGTRPMERGAGPPYPAVLDMFVGRSDCRTCHQIDERSLGPSFLDIAERYKKDADAARDLAMKIIEGGSGVWGESTMPAHPVLPVTDALTIAEYILAFSADGNNRRQALPLKGTYTFTLPKGVDRRGVFVLRAAYTDAGAIGAQPLQSEHLMILENPYVPASRVDQISHSKFNRAINLDESNISMDAPGAWIRLRKIDLTGIGALRIAAKSFFPGAGDSRPQGSVLEIRIDSPDGRLIGKTADTALSGSQPVIAGIEALTGKHDLFLVFKSPNTGSAAGKINFQGIEFRAR